LSVGEPVKNLETSEWKYVAALEPGFVEVPAQVLLNVNDADGLDAAQRLLTAGPGNG